MSTLLMAYARDRSRAEQQSNKTVKTNPARALGKTTAGETQQSGGPDRIRTGGLVLDRDACSATTPRDQAQMRLYRLASRVANRTLGGGQRRDQRFLAQRQRQIAARL